MFSPIGLPLKIFFNLKGLIVFEINRIMVLNNTSRVFPACENLSLFNLYLACVQTLTVSTRLEHSFTSEEQILPFLVSLTVLYDK